MTRLVPFIVLAAMIYALRSHFVGLYFYPDAVDYGTPAARGIPHEEVFFPSAGGRRLHGYFFAPPGGAIGTVVHCHGNAANVTNHYPLALFLVNAGFNVLAFDYAGFGRSEGTPSPEGIIEDTRAALAYVRERPDVDATRLALFGQSIGAAAAAGAMAREPDVRIGILDSPFTTYRAMAYATGLGKMLFFIVPFVIPDLGPARDIPAIAPRPVILVHGDADRIIPTRFSRRLHEASPDHTSLVIIPGAGHLTNIAPPEPYRSTIVRFLRFAMEPYKTEP